MAGPTRVPCVGAIVHDADGRLLLVLRGRAPAAGAWSLPGGRVEPGETDVAACRREVAEETGLVVEVGPLVGTVQRPGPAGTVYDIADHACAMVGGHLRSGDDAADVAWFTPAQVRAVETAPGLVTTLTAWGVLAAPG